MAHFFTRVEIGISGPIIQHWGPLIIIIIGNEQFVFSLHKVIHTNNLIMIPIDFILIV